MLPPPHRTGYKRYSQGFLEKLSDKSKQALFWGFTSGYYGAKKPYLAVFSVTKTASKSPLTIYQTVSRREVLGNPLSWAANLTTL